MSTDLYDDHNITLTRYVGPDRGDGRSRLRFQLTIVDEHGLHQYVSDLQIGHLAELAEVIMREYNR